MDQKQLYLAVAALTVLAVAATGGVAAQEVDCSEVEFDGGDGDGEPYQISTVEQLQCVEEEHRANYTLVEDVDASATESWNDGAGFEPIGGDPEAREPVLEGSFDGDGHEISNLTINRSDENYVGLFSATAQGAEIVDVSVTDADVEGSRFVGALVGYNDGEVNRSSSSGDVDGRGLVGGLVGVNDRDPLSYSSSSAEVSGVREVGGLAGRVFASTVQRSYSTGEVDAEEIAGGLVGDNWGEIEDSYSTADVDADFILGGLVGQNVNPHPLGGDFYVGEVRRSYAAGNVSGDEPETTGGFVGENEFSVATHNLSANGTVENSYWDVDATGLNSSDGGQGLSTGEMTGDTAVDNMEGFDFDGVWNTTESYPELRMPEQEDEEEGLPGMGFVAALAALSVLAYARFKTSER